MISAILPIVAFLISVSSYPYKLTCDRQMLPGSVIMGNVAKAYNGRTVVISRNGVTLPSGSQFVSGETLLVQVSTIQTTTSYFKFMFQASGGALFPTTDTTTVCGGVRHYNLDATGTLGDVSLTMPTTNNTEVNVWVAWATQYGTVYVSNNITLINFPSTQSPSFSPDYKTVAPTNKPTKAPFIKVPTSDVGAKLSFPNTTQQSYTLVLRKEVLSGHFGKTMITVNHTVPGPTLRVKVNQWIVVNVINQLGDDVSAIHWHGFDQKATPWNDGVSGVSQCPINTFANSTTGALF